MSDKKIKAMIANTFLEVANADRTIWQKAGYRISLQKAANMARKILSVL